MREMKDSGLEWVGEVGVDCSFVPLKYFLESKDAVKVGPFGSQLSGNDFSDDVTDYWVYNQRTVIDNEYETGNAYIQKEKFDSMASFHVHADDILITTRGTIGKISKVPCGHKKGVLHPCIIRFRIDPKKYCYKLLEIIFNSSDFVTRQIIYKSNATTIEVIYSDTLRNIILPYYEYERQEQIADYLEKQCNSFNALIADIQSQIEALEEYKRSVITEAVTKGLDPDVEMRDSGIAWVGEIPAHWLVEKVKFHLQRNEPRNPGDKQVLSVYREYGVIPKDSRDDNHNVTSEDTSNYKYVVSGNLVINKMKAWQGSMGVSEYEGIVSPAYFIYKFTDNQIIPKYLHYLLRSCYKDEFRRISGGIREGQWDLSPYEFSNTLLLIPSTDEQNRIISYIDARISEIEAAIAEKKQQIETIEEYKKSLIFEYVTGKKEVQV